MGKYMLMPKLDMSMEEGQILKWMCKVGDKTKRGDIVVEVETGKVALEVDNPTADGTILALYVDEGDDVKVNTPIMYIGEEGEIPPTKEEALGGGDKSEPKEEKKKAAPKKAKVSLDDFKGKFMLMPKLDMSMEEGQILKWMCKVGDETKRGDIVVEVETGKVALEVDNPTADGTILALYAEEGEDVKVNEPIIFIGEKGSTPPTKEEAMIITHPELADEAEDSAEDESAANSHDYDLAVIGAGPGGYVCAIRAAQLGAKVVIFEKEHIGGVCLNKGCIPTKAFVKNAEVLREVKNAAEMGIEIDSFKTDWKKVIERKNSVVSKLTGGVSGLLKRQKVEIVMSEAVITAEHEITADGKTYNVDNIVVACGSMPVQIPIENDNTVKLYDSEGMLNLEELPKNLVIIGGGVIGVEMAGIMAEYDVNVTIVEMLDSILAMADTDVINVVDKELRGHGIEIITGVGASKLVGGKVVLSDGREIEADAVLMSVGRKPVPVENKVNLKVSDRGYLEINDKLQTNVPNIYAIGDVTGKVMLAHTASRQGIVVAEDLYGEGATVDYSRIPSCVFTIPEVAWIGLNEKQAEELGIPYKSSKMPFAGVGKALAMNDTTGFVKVITDERFDEIIGVHIVGLNASDIVAQGAIAIDLEATSEEIANITFAHPTLSEGFMEACEGISGKMIHG